MSEMKEPGRARSGLSESFRLFLYKFSSSSPFSPPPVDSSTSDVKLQNLEDRDAIREMELPKRRGETTVSAMVPAGYCSRLALEISFPPPPNFGNLLAIRDERAEAQEAGGRRWRFLKGGAEK